MINEPTITASCDKCGYETEPMELCALAGSGWDDRYIKRTLERGGWRIEGNKTICEDCLGRKEE